MRRIAVALALSFVLVLIAQPAMSETVYDVKGYYNITWYSNDPDPIRMIIQRINITENITIERIKLPVGLEIADNMPPDKVPTLHVGFGVYANDTANFLSDIYPAKIIEKEVTKAGTVSLNINRLLTPGVYAVYAYVTAEDQNTFINIYLETGTKLMWWWKIPYAGYNVVPGKPVIEFRHVTYNWGFLGFGKSWSSYVYQEEYDSDIALTIETPGKEWNGFSPPPWLGEDSGESLQLLLLLSIIIPVAVVLFRRSGK